jgi:hypothetical protein
MPTPTTSPSQPSSQTFRHPSSFPSRQPSSVPNRQPTEEIGSPRVTTLKENEKNGKLNNDNENHNDEEIEKNEGDDGDAEIDQLFSGHSSRDEDL